MKAFNCGVANMGLSLVTGPLHTIALSMQVSVLPHLTLYGDVKEEDVKKAKKGFVRNNLEKLLGEGSSETRLIKIDPKLAAEQQALMTLQEKMALQVVE
jgi:hypothetical protein